MLTWSTTGPIPWHRLRRFRPHHPEPIELSAQRYGFLPARFRHQGRLHRVTRIERVWEVRGRGTQADRRCFAVSCADAQRCTLVHELRAGTWHVVW